MSQWLGFEIAKVKIRCNNEQNDIMQQELPYTNFKMDLETVDISLYYKICKKLPNPQGKLIYQDERNQIYSSSMILRYIGNYSKRDSLMIAESCIQYDESDKRKYEIYLVEERGLSTKTLFRGMGLEFLMAVNRRIMLHSSFIVWKGKGIVFTAPPGTGKSTQAELWKKYRQGTEIINGDRSILACDSSDEIPMVYSLPFCGSSKIALNKNVPLGAIVVLRQGKTNKIQRLAKREAVSFIFSECTISPWDKECMENTLDVLLDIVQRIPVYYFSCLPCSSAVDVLEYSLKSDW